ncbi:peptidoglycan-binding domain-containing protein [Nodularia spumigena CS-586/05]|uniref:peptidoglycan-binding domain-containing protein n=1 Tax=Nodularia spumigena TaxID=70799 RepID=UPI00232CB08E|nr:peptidoglycan-binding domain-containing protein [Nodularia spumigena]MDB9345773.1 peptidoglycan-binding domain-containing protein [Nodularia spumigena CS-588/06]MDB9369884.1 peptidoglycan-binding domain-containing protein [Nodularia spumigena CS-586/05]
MLKLHIGLTKNKTTSQLRLQIEEKKRRREITNLTTFTNEYTGELIMSLETDSNEIIALLQNSGGRIITNEEYEALTSFSKGDKGSDVQNIQRYLYNKGYYPSNPDFQPYDSHGASIFIFDEETELAVKDFQRSNGLAITGIVNEETRKKLADS